MTATENKPETKKDKISDGAILEALYKQVDRVEDVIQTNRDMIFLILVVICLIIFFNLISNINS